MRPGTNRAARRRIPALRHRQRVLRAAAESGRYFPKGTANRSSPEFADYLLEVTIRYPEVDTIHWVLDNLSSHTRKAVLQRFGEKAGGCLWERFTVHYTPKHGSWRNQAEIGISLYSRRCLGRRPIGDRASLRRQTQAWSRRMNRQRVPIQCNFNRKKARTTFEYTITRSRYLGWVMGRASMPVAPGRTPFP
jgi:hypothetical protein